MKNLDKFIKRSRTSYLYENHYLKTKYINEVRVMKRNIGYLMFLTNFKKIDRTC